MDVFSLIDSPRQEHYTKYDHQYSENNGPDDVHIIRGGRLTILIKAKTRNNETHKTN